MRLKEIIPEIQLTKKQENFEITDISIDPGRVKKGDLFFDLKGDGDLNKILGSGARFIVRYSKFENLKSEHICTYEDIRRLFALASKRLYQNSCDDLKIIGITGTNGKTSTTKLVADILTRQGKKVGTIGTMGCDFLGNHIETGFTTPDPHVLHSLFFMMKKMGVEFVVMEVSAHAIFLKKLEAIKFEVLCLTNITEDHLDFFKTFENYASVKLSFLSKEHAKRGVICFDDENIRKFEFDLPVVSYAINNPSDIFAMQIKSDFDGSRFTVNCLDEVEKVSTLLVGEYNVLNTLAAVGICSCLGVSLKDCCEALRFSTAELGRFNVIKFKNRNIVIDYAHTPDGLEKVLKTSKALSKNKLFVVFGCGGNRDKLKRPIMCRIAESLSDKVYVTSDNPRFEKPTDIIKEILEGSSKQNTVPQPDRKKAIRLALSEMKEGDTLVIAGKGGENYQDINGQKIPYSDFDEVYSFFRSNLTII